MINPTASRDGVSRIDIRVSFRLSRGEVESILKHYAAIWVDSASTEALPAKEILAMVRITLSDIGQNAYVFDGSLDDEQEEWVVRNLDKLWPVDRGE